MKKTRLKRIFDTFYRGYLKIGKKVNKTRKNKVFKTHSRKEKDINEHRINFFIYVLADAPIASRGSVFEGIAKEVLN